MSEIGVVRALLYMHASVLLLLVGLLYPLSLVQVSSFGRWAQVFQFMPRPTLQ
jgi:hypothetical protein